MINIFDKLFPSYGGKVITDSKYIKDAVKNKNLEDVVKDIDNELARQQGEISALHSGNYVTVTAEGGDTSVEDIMTREGITPAVDTIYRIGAWDGTQYDDTAYSEYSWNQDDGYKFIATHKEKGIDTDPTAGSHNLVESGGVQNELALGAVYDVSVKNPTAGPNNDGKWESLSALLSDVNLNTLIPTSVRKGGMSIKFVQSFDNKYVQYRLTAKDFSINVSDWQSDFETLDSPSDFAISDESSNDIVRFNDGHVKTKYFDSSKDATTTERGLMSANDKIKLNSIEQGAEVNDILTESTDESDLDVSDENNKKLVEFRGGHIRTKNFDSKTVKEKLDTVEEGAEVNDVITDNTSIADLNISDEQENVLIRFANGHFSTRNFNSLLIKNKIDSLPSHDKILPIQTPKAIYTVCNDINVSDSCAYPWIAEDDSIINSRQYCQKVRIDHFFSFLTETPDVSINGNGQRFIIFDSILSPSTISNYKNIINVNSGSYSSTVKKQDLNIQTIPFVLKGDYYKDIPFSIKHISVRNKATENKHVRLLCIGDSVTAGSYGNVNKPYRNAPGNYWSWVKCLFELDNLQNNGGFDCVMLGNHIRSSSWGRKYQETFDINFHGLTKNNVKASACGDGGTVTADWISGNYSEFYDTVNQKFSVKYWVDNYRTLDVNEDGSVSEAVTKGPKVVGGYIDGLVCEPTHILIQLGYNESYKTQGTVRTNYLNNLQIMINTIRNEYPDAYILLSLPDCAGTYYPEDYPNYSGMSDSYNFLLDMTKGDCKDFHDRWAFMNKDLMDLEDEENNIFYVPSYFVSPCCDQAPHRDSNELCYLSNQSESAKHYSMIGWGPYHHPNNAGHAAWAYQIYSLIKYTLLLN